VKERNPCLAARVDRIPLARFTDQEETYGPRVVEQLVRNLSHLKVVIDLGAGAGRDLEIVRRLHSQEYHDEFATYPARAQLETNFWAGHVPTRSQYWQVLEPLNQVAAPAAPFSGKTIVIGVLLIQQSYAIYGISGKCSIFSVRLSRRLWENRS